MHADAYEWLWSELAQLLGSDPAAALRAEFLRRQSVPRGGEQNTWSSHAGRLQVLERAVADTVFVDTDVAVLVAHRLIHDPDLVSEERKEG